MLADYFVETHQYNVVLKPGFHLVVGRKGTGKTAISYRVASQLKHDGNAAVCEIRPNEYELMSLHVSQTTRRAAPMHAAVQARLAELLEAHSKRTPPPQTGRSIGLRRPER